MDKIIRLLSDYEELNKQNTIIAIFAMYMSISFEILYNAHSMIQ